MKSEAVLPGINIQFPWSRLLLDGSKSIETRGYPLPEKFKGKELAIIETPGREGRGSGIYKAQVIGIIVFSESFRYETKSQWKSDMVRHKVPPDHDLYGFDPTKPKYGWKVERVQAFEIPLNPPAKRGRVYSLPFRIKLNGQR